LKTLKITAGFLLLLSIINHAYSLESHPEMRGIWLSRAVMTSGLSAMRTELEKIKNAGYNAVFVNNWYQGGMIYESDVLESYGGSRQLSEYLGRDPMVEIIEEGHRLGLEVHAWFEYGLWGWLSYDSTNYGPILSTRKDWLMKDRTGHYFNIMSGVIYQFWMDPAHPEVVQFMSEIYAECARKYPDLDGIQTDRIRYPNPNFSFSDISRTRYQSDTGGSDPVTLSENDPEWEQFLNWRKEQTTFVAGAIYRAVKEENPACLVSAAVAPPYMLSGSDNKLQDWPEWARQGYTDLLCPMLYGLHTQINYWLDRCLTEFNSPLRFAPGFDLSSASLPTLTNTVNAMRKKGFAGSVTWYYGDLTPDRQNHFKSEIYPQYASTFHRSPTIDNKDISYVNFTNMTELSGGYKGSYHHGSSVSAFSWHIPLYVSGDYRIQVYIPSEWSGADSLYYQIMYQDSVIDCSIPRFPGWNTLLRKSIPYTVESVIITLTGSNTSEIAADAARLSIKEPLKILDAYTPDENTLNLLFNNKLDMEERIHSGHFAMSGGVHITDVQVDKQKPTILTLYCTPLSPGVEYLLKAGNLPEEDGTLSDSVLFTFTYSAGQDTIIDNDDTFFTVQSGTWTPEFSADGFTGSGYLTALSGDGTSRVFWRYAPPVSGWYRISALFPAGPDFVSDAMYILKEGTAYDTLSIDQSRTGINMAVLGVQWLDAGTYAVVKLHNDCPLSPEKKVAADAVRISRIFPSTIQEEPEETLYPSLFFLTDNYPNPFNSRTRFNFFLQEAGEVSVTIYNVKGQLIRHASHSHQAGNHTFELDMSSEVSGLYLYHFYAHGIHCTGKMLYIK
jgi:uncharacterized lipoprotein YddW (UPF0748 family)